MRLRKVVIENTRSFLRREELVIDGDISILIGPNGGGKTNTLDIAVMAIRKFLLASPFIQHNPTPENPDRYLIQPNDHLNNIRFEKHNYGKDRPQQIELTVEVTSRDIENMQAMHDGAAALAEQAEKKYVNLPIREALDWDMKLLSAGQQLTFKIQDGNFIHPDQDDHRYFLQYLRMFEIDSQLREEYKKSSLSTPVMYLPVNRATGGFQSSIQLAGYNEADTKRQLDAAHSRTGSSPVALAIGRLAQKYRLLLEGDKGTARKEFYEDKNLKELTKLLNELGYEWKLESTNPLNNLYNVRLSKQGVSFLVDAASSGEKEVLTYLFAIYALNVKDALIIVDEPELHLHPKWQRTLLNLFVELSAATGNQFLLATHSPTFVGPESINYISRIHSVQQESRISRLDYSALPEFRHLLSIVNSQNNERIFFSDAVILVEGISDRIFFEAVLRKLGVLQGKSKVLEIINVGGKGMFSAYEKVLDAANVKHKIVADLDYIEQIGSPELKALFKTNKNEIKKDVFENLKSMDAETFVDNVEGAIRSGDWSSTRDLWEYIKSHRRKLDPSMSATQKEALATFIEQSSAQGTMLLSLGTLEAYLPDSMSRKDVSRLIKFVSNDNFWAALSDEAKAELERIANWMASDLST